MLNTLVAEQERAAPLARCDAAELHQETQATAVVSSATLALWVVLASVAMLFAGFTSAYLVRRTASDWVPIYSPPLLWLNTIVLVASSFALEKSKTSRGTGSLTLFRGWLLASVGLGVAFVAGQILAWKVLSAAGIFLPTSPHSSFFYMLTAVHAAHVLGGIALLLVLLLREWHIRAASQGESIELAATYWHFVTGIWVFLYVLLFVWR